MCNVRSRRAYNGTPNNIGEHAIYSQSVAELFQGQCQHGSLCSLHCACRRRYMTGTLYQKESSSKHTETRKLPSHLLRSTKTTECWLLRSKEVSLELTGGST